MASSSPSPSLPTGSVMSVAVVGGGVSGLAAAYKLKKSGLRVTLYETDERVGGKLKSTRECGLLWDEGANTMTESEGDVGRLIDDLGLRDKQQLPIAQNKRYIVKNGSAQLVPLNPFALFTSEILSTKSKLRIFLEPLLWRHSNRNSSKVSEGNLSESVAQFFQRHFGEEVVDYLIDPFVAGTSAGDPESLSMRHTFPDLWNLEKKYGSVLVGAIRSKLSKGKEKGQREHVPEKRKNVRGSFSFYGGMQTLTDKLSEEIGAANVKLNSEVLSLSCGYNGSSPNSGWSISYATKDASTKEFKEQQAFDAVIMTAPLSSVKKMTFCRGGDPFYLDFLPKCASCQLLSLPISGCDVNGAARAWVVIGARNNDAIFDIE